VPDTWSTIYEFQEKGCTVTFTSSMNTTVGQSVEICGKEATLRFDAIAHNITTFDIIPEKFTRNPNLPKGYEPGKTPEQPNHMVDWVNCIQDRSTPKCSTDEAFIETATAVMSVESYHRKRLVRWNPVKEEIV